jgi:hypothetical protein
MNNTFYYIKGPLDLEDLETFRLQLWMRDAVYRVLLIQ